MWVVRYGVVHYNQLRAGIYLELEFKVMGLKWAVSLPGLFAGTIAGTWYMLWTIILVNLFGFLVLKSVVHKRLHRSFLRGALFVCLTLHRLNSFPCMIASYQPSFRGIALILWASLLQKSSWATGTSNITCSRTRVSLKEPTRPSYGDNLWSS